MIKISVVVAARNAGATIERALQSIMAQTRPPLEIIVVDDGSEDDTSERAQCSGAPIRLLRVEYGNAAASRNAAIRAASGNWLAFLDADDEWYSHHLEIAASALASSHDVAYVAAADYIDQAGRKLLLNPCPPAEGTRSTLDHHFFISWFRRYSWFCNCTALLRKDAVDAVEGFDEALLRRHDLDLFLRVIHDRTWAYSPVPAARIQLGTPGSISGLRVSCDFYLLKALAELCALYDSEEYRTILNNRACCALNSALALGSPGDVGEAWKIGRQHLRLTKRIFYRCAIHAPRPGRRMLRFWHTRNQLSKRNL